MIGRYKQHDKVTMQYNRAQDEENYKYTKRHAMINTKYNTKNYSIIHFLIYVHYRETHFDCFVFLGLDMTGSNQN